ncbi:hypothetical protein BLNAU_1134 [Blattamonas nauphoetae]|uniref:Uncharacterized protein n=1 Tax=Blattamonas nauphoetae TaxID=2049346 RepID=A0ABQ9YJW5_9EUKA|nr:hypothetical protein BLNAU_1134 [Blattamonas nauphoetae]
MTEDLSAKIAALQRGIHVSDSTSILSLVLDVHQILLSNSDRSDVLHPIWENSFLEALFSLVSPKLNTPLSLVCGSLLATVLSRSPPSSFSPSALLTSCISEYFGTIAKSDIPSSACVQSRSATDYCTTSHPPSPLEDATKENEERALQLRIRIREAEKRESEAEAKLERLRRRVKETKERWRMECEDTRSHLKRQDEEPLAIHPLLFTLSRAASWEVSGQTLTHKSSVFSTALVDHTLNSVCSSSLSACFRVTLRIVRKTNEMSVSPSFSSSPVIGFVPSQQLIHAEGENLGFFHPSLAFYHFHALDNLLFFFSGASSHSLGADKVVFETGSVVELEVDLSSSPRKVHLVVNGVTVPVCCSNIPKSIKMGVSVLGMNDSIEFCSLRREPTTRVLCNNNHEESDFKHEETNTEHTTSIERDAHILTQYDSVLAE